MIGPGLPPLEIVPHPAEARVSGTGCVGPSDELAVGFKETNGLENARVRERTI